MRLRLFLALSLCLIAGLLAPLGAEERQSKSLLIRGGFVVDGSGKPGKVQDVRIEGARIVEIGSLTPRHNEKWWDATGLVVAPGFIDAHSHTDGAMEKEPLLESQVRQGITTAIVGQDGGSSLPIQDFFEKVERSQPSINFATFCGHGTLRRNVLGDDYKRAAKDSELDKMKDLLAHAMQAGALGLSSGLEYDPGYYATTVELVELAKVAARYEGIYISHTRSDGGGSNMQSLNELRLIAKEARIPAQVSHIKLAVGDVWKLGSAIRQWMLEARRERLDITADVYPYLYWQSTITVLMPERDWQNRSAWEKALQEIGGPQNVVLARYTPQPEWQGKDLAEIARTTGKTAVDVVIEIVEKTHSPGSKESESIVCKAMLEEDFREFLRDPNIMFCSDGSHGGSHPRGAGSFPKILGRYVRDEQAIALEEAIRKATSFPARRFGLPDRGELKKGMKADVVVFDPKRIRDRATIEEPRAMAEGIVHVLVNGVPVLEDEKMTGARPGVGLRRHLRSIG